MKGKKKKVRATAVAATPHHRADEIAAAIQKVPGSLV
jgi:hypothetical protein